MKNERLDDLLRKFKNDFYSMTVHELLTVLMDSGSEKLEVVPRKEDDTPTCAIILVDGPRVEEVLAALKVVFDN